jgi:acetoin utilization deacetylase AcuC-like enzyme
MSTGFVCDERYFWWDARSAGLFMPSHVDKYVEPYQHIESPESKRRMRNLVEISGLLKQLTPIEPRFATVEELARVHDHAHIDRMRELSEADGGDAGELTPFAAGGYEIARLAAGGTLAAIEAVMDGTVDNVYALVRPPGHHAEKDRGRGFCMFGNCAVGAAHARQSLGLSRVAIIDWDVHHGNGSQWLFYDDPSVLTISLHQDRNYPPDSGFVSENGKGAGEGANVNVPLPPGSGTGAYVAAFERVVAPSLRRFKPELLIVASGLDASVYDPLARQMMTSDGYRDLTKIMMDVASEVGGKLVVSHEGGYSPVYVAFCGLAVVETLAGVRTIPDPYLDMAAGMGAQELQPHQDAAIKESEALVDKVPAP